MPRFPTATLTLTFLLVLAAGPLAAEGAGTWSLDLALSLELLRGAGPGTSLTLDCDGTTDGDIAAMMAALRRQGRRGTYKTESDGQTFVARRRGDSFQLTVSESGERKLYLEVPWKLADCLLDGARGGRKSLQVANLFDRSRRVKVRLEGGGEELRFRLGD